MAGLTISGLASRFSDVMKCKLAGYPHVAAPCMAQVTAVATMDDLRLERFPTTRWSLVGQAGSRERSMWREALGNLLTHYMPALRAHLVLARRIRPDDAEDMLQSFITSKFLDENLAANADPSCGKFRTYLLTILDRFLISEYRKATRQKRGGGQACDVDPQELALIASGDKSSSDAFDIAWARELLAKTIHRMEVECLESGRPHLWGVFEGRLLGPLLRGSPILEYPALIEEFGFQTPTEATNALVTAKRMFQRHLRSTIAEYADSPEQIEEEIRDVLNILSRAGAES